MYAQVSEGIAKNKVYQGFSGGMMLHTGYSFGQDKNAPLTADGRSTSPQGALFGIGGALRVHLWKYLRLPPLLSQPLLSRVSGVFTRFFNRRWVINLLTHF